MSYKEEKRELMNVKDPIRRHKIIIWWWTKKAIDSVKFKELIEWSNRYERQKSSTKNHKRNT